MPWNTLSVFCKTRIGRGYKAAVGDGDPKRHLVIEQLQQMSVNKNDQAGLTGPPF